MEVTDILTVERTACGISATSKKRVLEKLSEMIASAEPHLTPGEVFDCLLARERLGSTGLGQGVAIPHGRISRCSRTLGAFIKLVQGVDYDAIDRQPVDLLFALLVPHDSTDEHLEVLSNLAEIFSDTKFREQLRASTTGSDAFSLITGWKARG